MACIGGLAGGSALDEELKQSNVVRLRGLPFSASEMDIVDFFKGLELGPDGVVICVIFQGRSTGQAYVQFVNTEVANRALERNRQHIGSRYIEVFKGHPSTHADGRPNGEAFVEFENEDAAAHAMQLHRESMGSRYVELFRSTKGEMMEAVQQRMHGSFYRMSE